MSAPERTSRGPGWLIAIGLVIAILGTVALGIADTPLWPNAIAFSGVLGLALVLAGVAARRRGGRAWVWGVGAVGIWLVYEVIFFLVDLTQSQ